MVDTVIRYGNNVSTDDIIPAKYRYLSLDLPKMAEHAFEDLDSNFIKKVKTAHFIAAGENFGCGSSREYAPVVLKECGVTCIVAKSFGRIFYRNSINLGLFAIECNTDGIADGDEITINLDQNTILNHTKDTRIKSSPIPRIIRRIVEQGGVIQCIRTYGNFDNFIKNCE
jgi:3-isopropylmalate/(R)-2-methylmalate dehydratase small subunit